jgi:hypothetical protein
MVQQWGYKGIQTTTNVDHLGKIVPGLQQAATFFADVLGADYLFSSNEGPGTENPANLNKTFDVHPESKLTKAMLRLGPTLNLELMEYDSPDQKWKMPKKSDNGAPHLAFFVHVMQAAPDDLTAKGRHLFDGPFLSEKGPEQGQSIRCFARPWDMFLEILSRLPSMPYERTTSSCLLGPVPTQTALQNQVECR